MAKEIYLYGSIYSYAVVEFQQQMEAAKNDDIIVRVNGPGGEPSYMMGASVKFEEHKKGKQVIVDGRAYSAHCFFICSADKTKGTKGSTYLIHRAAYEEDVERVMSDALRKSITYVNDELKRKLSSRIDVNKFKEITGKSLDEVFSMDSRIDVVLNVNQALEIGLIDEIYDPSPQEKATIDAKFDAVMLAHSSFEPKKEDKPKQAKKMNIDSLKAEHPDLFNQVFNLGVAKEKDRAGAWATYVLADPEAVAKGIKDGAELSATTTAELNMKMFQKVQMTTLEKENPKSVETPDPAKAKTEDELKAESFFKEIMS